jgi:hypothetical protein
MRGRIALFLVLAVVVALVAAYAGWSASTNEAAGAPGSPTPSESSPGSVGQRPSGPSSHPSEGSGSNRSSGGSGSKGSPPEAAGQQGGGASQPGQPPKAPPASQPEPSTDPVRFGEVTTDDLGDTMDLSIDRDRRALTARFSALEAAVGDPTAEQVTTRSFSMTVPLVAGAKGETISFAVQGYAFGEKDGGENEDMNASGRLTLTVNGRTTVEHFPAGWDDSFVAVVDLPAVPSTTYRMTAVAEVRQDSDSGGQAYANISSVDVGIG